MNTYIRNAFLEYMNGHVGRAAAVPRGIVLRFLRILRPKLNDRDFREIYTDCPICSCEDGLFIPRTHEEVEACYEYLKARWGWRCAFRRRRTIYAYRPELRKPTNQGALDLRGAA